MPEEMPTVALLAGGLATRMRPATLHTAKSMLMVAGEPFLAHQLRLLCSQGVRRVVLCCGHFEEQLRDFAGDGAHWGCAIEYSSDGPEPLGTGGALRKALPLLGPAFMVMYGDSYLTAPLHAVWSAFLHAKQAGMMTVYRNDGQWDTSNIRFEAGEILAYDKQVRTASMHHIDYGLSCLQASAFAPWGAIGKLDLADVLSGLLRGKTLAGSEVGERFFEIGSGAGLAATEAMFLKQVRAARRHA